MEVIFLLDSTQILHTVESETTFCVRDLNQFLTERCKYQVSVPVSHLKNYPQV